MLTRIAHSQNELSLTLPLLVTGLSLAGLLLFVAVLLLTHNKSPRHTLLSLVCVVVFGASSVYSAQLAYHLYQEQQSVETTEFFPSLRHPPKPDVPAGQ